MTIHIENATLENVSMALKQGTAKLKFTTSELQVLPDAVRDTLSLLERTQNPIQVSLVSDAGDVMLDLTPCKVSAADIKIGPGRGVLAFTTGEMRAVWEARDTLKMYMLSDMDTMTVVIVERQPALISPTFETGGA